MPPVQAGTMPPGPGVAAPLAVQRDPHVAKEVKTAEPPKSLNQLLIFDVLVAVSICFSIRFSIRFSTRFYHIMRQRWKTYR